MESLVRPLRRNWRETLPDWSAIEVDLKEMVCEGK